MRIAFCSALIGAILVAGGAPARADDSLSPDLIRRIELEWAPLHGAVLYDFELGMSPDFESPLRADRTDETKVIVDMLPGTYFYRVRGIDKIQRPGKWTKVQELKINARPPVLVAPLNQEILRGNVSDLGIPLVWRSSGPGIRYLVEITAVDPLNGEFREVIVKEEVDGTEYAFFPRDPGTYQWQVSTLGNAGSEPGEPWTFEVEGVYPRDLPEDGSDAKRIVRFVPPWWRGHWTMTTRYGQYRLSYYALDQDLRAASRFSGIAGYAMGTLNWEWHDPSLLGGFPWWEVEVELDRQTVLTESVVMRRTYVRLGNWYDRLLGRNSTWRFSPIFEAGLREIAIYQPRRVNDAVRSNTSLQHLGFGIQAEKKFSESITLGFSFKYGMEKGGEGGLRVLGATGDQIDPNTRSEGGLTSDPALEVAVSTKLTLSPRMAVVGRVRYERFGGTWNPRFPLDAASPGGDGPSFFQATQMGFDAAFAFRF